MVTGNSAHTMDGFYVLDGEDPEFVLSASIALEAALNVLGFKAGLSGGLELITLSLIHI